MKFNYKVIINLLGMLILLNGVFMLFCIPFAYYFREEVIYSLFLPATITIVFGFVMFRFTKNNKNQELNKRDGYLIVTLGWLSMSLFGTLPYLMSGSIVDFTNAFFETISGYTTTGASVLNDIEAVPKGILFWRSLTQWIGGMGIIVLAVAILPILGIGGMQLFVAEAPGITPDKLKPRIADSAKRLWFLYVGLTVVETLLLWIGGMTFFDAINHSLTTTATGGFSTKNESIAHFQSPLLQYIIIAFMFLAGTNFSMTYFGLHGRFRQVLKNEEFRFYTLLVLGVTILMSALILNHPHLEDAETIFRAALFQTVSIITTTGYVSVDYSLWSSTAIVSIFVLMFIGASAGSTAGGVKIVRHLVLIKNSLLELKRQLHPSAIIPVRLNGKAVHRDITFNILAFIMIYISIFASGSIIMAFIGADFITSISSVATCLGNIGPGFGDVGPVENFDSIPPLGKWFLSFLMLLGRLELFTVLMLLSPYFWRKI